MIPHRLCIKNFLSYGPDLQTIDFSPYHLIHLSGKNGHGKSALLDAMTWALWGQARKITNAVKPDQGLLRSGQTHMIVIFDFELNGQMYRVRRECELAHQKMVARLEFGLLNVHERGVGSLTDKAVRLTQDVIERTIRLDYESFVNSAFLRQGHANEFSQKSPKDRKEVLGTILGLQQFELIKKRAMDCLRDLFAQRQSMLALHDAIVQQLHNEKEVENQLQHVGHELEQLLILERALHDVRSGFVGMRAELGEKQKLRDMVLFKKQQLTSLFKQQAEQLKVHVARWRAVHKKQLLNVDTQDIEVRRREYIQRLDLYQKVAQERLQWEKRIFEKRSQLQAIAYKVQEQSSEKMRSAMVVQERLRYELGSLQVALEQCAVKKKECELRLVHYQSEWGELAQHCWSAESLRVAERQFEKRKNVYQQLVERNKWLKTEIDALHQKCELVHDDNPSCPLCDQSLSASRRKFLRGKFVKQQSFIEHQISRISFILDRLKQLLIDQHQEIVKQKELVAKQAVMDAEQKTIVEMCEGVVKQEALYRVQCGEVNGQLLAIEKEIQKQNEAAKCMLSNDVLYGACAAELKELETTFAQVNYDEHDHELVRKKLQEIEQQLALYVHIQIDARGQEGLAETVHGIVEQLKLHKKDIARYQQEIEGYSMLDTERAALDQKIQEEEKRFGELIIRKEQFLELQGSLKSKAEHMAQLRDELEKQKMNLAKYDDEIEDYRVISAAVGKDGIQALLIEEAIPEIEQEANRLLAKLTNNQSQIFIESLRDLKSGGSKETLDINITDSSGMRPYELFSGGEAFRIDFALRIAISKLLARRAGTCLQTLIIDEGFGSQDEDGLALIMDAIYKIQDDFEKIIIVSHLPSMKEQFPVHFVVEKGMNGSHVKVVEHA